MEEEVRVSSEMQGNDEAAIIKPFLGLDFGLHIECFRGTNLKRTMASILVAWAQQVIGAPFVVGYSTYFLQLIGIENAFNASVALYVLMVVASSAAFPLTEVVGRRTMLIGPQFVLCFILLLIGIMGCVPDHAKANWAIVVFMYIWTIIFQMSISATGFVIASEIATMRLRAVTQGMVTIFNAIASLVMSFVMPYLVSTKGPPAYSFPLPIGLTFVQQINPDAANLGGKVGFVFLATGLMVSVAGYFLYPETKVLNPGLSVAEQSADARCL